jgi:hypothetical protein
MTCPDAADATTRPGSPGVGGPRHEKTEAARAEYADASATGFWADSQRLAGANVGRRTGGDTPALAPRVRSMRSHTLKVGHGREA